MRWVPGLGASAVGRRAADRRTVEPGTVTRRSVSARIRGLGRALAVGWIVVAPACTGEPAEAPAARATAVPGAPVEVERDPRLVVGGASGDTLHELFGVVTPFLLPDGRLAVPLSPAGTIRIFGPDGTFRASLGRPGEGPGEFDGLSAAWARGDTVEAFDRDLARITRFRPDGPVEVVPLQGPPVVAAVPGTFEQGWVLVAIPGGAPGGRDRMVYHRFGRDGVHAGEVAESEGMHRFATEAVSGPDPLSPMARAAMAGGVLYLAETMIPVARVFDARGERDRIRWTPEPSMAPEQAFGIIADSAAARVARGDIPAALGNLDGFPVRDRVPAFWDLLADPEGFLWVQPFDPGRHSMALPGSRGDGPWRIVAPGEGEVGSITVPEGLHPSRITGDALVGIHRDDLGVETVRVHRVRRR